MKSLISNLKQSLVAPRNDGMLHFSSHLQHDRHTALYWYLGYPEPPEPTWQRAFPLLQGTGVHEVIHAKMADLYPKYVPEHPVVAPEDEWKYPWVGSVDAYVEDVDGQVWLLDYKTISGAGMSLLGDTPKPEHILQASAYYHFGPTQDVRTAIVYLPSGSDYKRRWAEPIIMEFTPLDITNIRQRMTVVETSIDTCMSDGILPTAPEGAFVWKSKGKDKWDLVYRPHYSSLFCPWAHLVDDPCGCSDDETFIAATIRGKDLVITTGYEEVTDDAGYPDGYESA
jgi:hypothetical protein